MGSKKKILIAAKDQFGYSTTIFKHCQYLKEHFEVTYIGWDFDRKKMELPGVQIKYVSREGNKTKRTLRLIGKIKESLAQHDIAFGTYFLGISLLKFLGIRKEYKVYIDTLYVASNGLKKHINDLVMRIELLFFNDIAVISDGVAKQIGLSKYKILPLGGESYKTEFDTNTDQFNLLYVGTLGGRKIMECVQGFHKFLAQRKDKDKFRFRIVGDSDTGERQEIDNYIKKNSLENYVLLLGYIPRHDLNAIYNNSNLGISFVPLSKEFDKQPPTKTYEYLVSGLPVIATSTTSNKEIITEKDGLLTLDNPDDFCSTLSTMYDTIKNYSPEEIKSRNERYKWQHVVEKNLMPILAVNSKV